MFEMVLDWIITAWDWARAKFAGACRVASGHAWQTAVAHACWLQLAGLQLHTSARLHRAKSTWRLAAAALFPCPASRAPVLHTGATSAARRRRPPFDPYSLAVSIRTPPTCPPLTAGATQRSAAEAAYFEPLAEIDPEDHRSPPLFPGR